MEIFGIGAPEILLIMVVALVVFGPDKLPEIAREAGKMVRAFRQLTNEATSEIRNLTQETGLSEEIKNIRTEINGVTQSVRQEMTSIKTEMSGIGNEVTTTVTEQYKVSYEPTPDTIAPEAPVEANPPMATITSTVREVSDAERDEFNRRRLAELAEQANANTLIESAVNNHPATAPVLDAQAAETAAVDAAYEGWYNPPETSAYQVPQIGSDAADAGEPLLKTKPRIGKRSAFGTRKE